MTAGTAVLIGGGEHAGVVVEAARAAQPPWAIAGYLDPVRRPEFEERYGVGRLGGDEWLERADPTWLVLGFGSYEEWSRRADLVQRCGGRAGGWATIVHGSALVSPSARLGEGTVVLPRAVVHAGAVVGPHCVLNSGCIVEHDCRIGAQVHVGPGAVLGGGVSVGDGAYIGLGALVRDHRRIGDGVTVGMGAAVVTDVLAGRTVKGVPAR